MLGTCFNWKSDTKYISIITTLLVADGELATGQVGVGDHIHHDIRVIRELETRRSGHFLNISECWWSTAYIETRDIVVGEYCIL